MQTTSVTLPSTEFPELDDTELALVSGGFGYLLDGAAGGAAVGGVIGGRTGAVIGGATGAVGGFFHYIFG